MTIMKRVNIFIMPSIFLAPFITHTTFPSANTVQLSIATDSFAYFRSQT